MNALNSRPVTLLVSPIVPNPTGSGLAQRACRLLGLLAQEAPTHLLLAQTDAALPSLPDAARSRITGYTSLRTRSSRSILRRAALAVPWLVLLNHALATDWLIPIGQPIGDKLPECVGRLVVFRLRTHDIPSKIPPELLGSASRHLDLDDLESVTLRSTAALAWAQGKFKFACSLASRSLQYRLLERRIAAGYDSVSLANPRDVARLVGRCGGANVLPLPNAVALPELEFRTMPDPAHPIFLFVGTLDYFPNSDAVEWIAGPICAAMREHLGRPFRVWIAGRGASQRMIDRLAGVPEIEFLGEVEDVGPLYLQCHAALAAVRGGGGTKIKVFEAMAYGCPSIATPHAVDGLAGVAGEHFLEAESSEDFAFACRTLIEQPALWSDISRAARRLVESQESSSTNLPFATENIRAEGY